MITKNTINAYFSIKTCHCTHADSDPTNFFAVDVYKLKTLIMLSYYISAFLRIYGYYYIKLHATDK